MKFKDENKAKELVTEIMSSEYVDIISGKGLFFNKSIIHNNKFSHITNDSEYPLIEEKVESILKLVNQNPSLVHGDLQDELWYMV